MIQRISPAPNQMILPLRGDRGCQNWNLSWEKFCCVVPAEAETQDFAVALPARLFELIHQTKSAKLKGEKP
jgi:hypothetical protein